MEGHIEEGGQLSIPQNYIIHYVSKISINYLTTNEPYKIEIRKFQKIRKTYSPDPDSGSGIRKI